MTELVGWIILGVVLLILALILFTPFGVSADYADGSVSLAARVFAFELKLLPRPERGKKGTKAKKEKPAKKAKKPGEPKPEKEKKPKPPLVTREMIPELVRLAGRTLSRFRLPRNRETAVTGSPLSKESLSPGDPARQRPGERGQRL